jgi:hypothetical protein
MIVIITTTWMMLHRGAQMTIRYPKSFLDTMTPDDDGDGGTTQHHAGVETIAIALDVHHAVVPTITVAKAYLN